MTTPSVMESVLRDLRTKYADALKGAADSSRLAMNSYGAGYDRGYADAIAHILIDITGDDPVTIDDAAIRAVLAEQADDEGLWFVPQTCAEEYLQKALRRLHAAVECKSPDECALDATRRL